MSAAAEARRQQRLLQALWGEAGPDALTGRLRETPQRALRGLQAYRANAGALAERALAAAFPTVAQLVGGESFAALARAFWHRHPPERGDIAQWGGALAGFIAAAPPLADEPYLADVARLDAAVHAAEQAADGGAGVDGLQRLAEADPAALWLRPAAGLALVVSRYPVAGIHQAHRSDAADRFAAVRDAFAGGRGEAALVYRDGFAARIGVLPASDACFVQALLDGLPLADALDAAGADFAFDAWLAQALARRWLRAVEMQAWKGRDA